MIGLTISSSDQTTDSQGDGTVQSVHQESSEATKSTVEVEDWNREKEVKSSVGIEFWASCDSHSHKRNTIPELTTPVEGVEGNRSETREEGTLSGLCYLCSPLRLTS